MGVLGLEGDNIDDEEDSVLSDGKDSRLAAPEDDVFTGSFNENI
jgi:hypothetical protein